MEIRELLHEVFKVKENHELPSRMMEVMLDENERNKALRKFKEFCPDLNHDYLRDYFQESQADRKNFMQDYTPEGVCTLLSRLMRKSECVADVCAGTGSLTIAAWIENPQAEFTCFEISSASIPFLLFNLALRNMKATVVQGDILAEEVEKVYRVEDGNITIINSWQKGDYDSVIMNPPYSLKYSGQHDPRFGDYAPPPSSKADLAFVLIGLSMMKEGGQLLAILPHGPLFRGAKEADIRKKLLENHMVRTVIGLPGKLFFSTDIPTQITEIANTDDLFVIDAANEFKKGKKSNSLEAEHIEKICSAYQARKDIEKFAHLCTWREVEQNGYNLNIPRYVDTSSDEEPIDMIANLKKQIEIQKEIRKNALALAGSVQSLVWTGREGAETWKEIQKLFLESATL